MNITERRPFTPGEILAEEFMQPYGLTQGELAAQLHVERRRINEIVNGKRAITPDTALRLAKFFNMTAEYWLNLQTKVDLWNEIHNQVTIKELRTIKAISAV
ncbi:MAG: HigA family addiction module antitoxin [Gammaproteobacteria bacterium]